MATDCLTESALDQLQGRRTNPPRVYRDGDQLAFSTGRTDNQLGYDFDQNPFMMPDNRAAWERGYRSAGRI